MTEKALSKNLLQMKFMQKTKKRIQVETIEKSTITHVVSNIGQTNERRSKFVIEPRITVLANLLECGRLSFQGFNADVEKCMAQCETLATEKQDKSDREKQGKDVNDQEMTARFSSISKNIAKKFTRKRQRVDNYGNDANNSNSNFINDAPQRKFRKPRD